VIFATTSTLYFQAIRTSLGSCAFSLPLS
jgi:hypothetical protein